MSLRLVAQISEARLKGLGPTERSVLMELGFFADDDGSDAYPSTETLSGRTLLSRATVCRSLASLVRAGFVERENLPRRRGRYRIRLEALARRKQVPHGETQDASECDTTLSLNQSLNQSEKQMSADGAVGSTSDSKRKRKANPASEPQELPFSSPEFAAALAAVKTHRAEIRKTLRPTSERALLKRLAGWGEEAATAALETSVANSWTGVFEPREGNPKSDDLEYPTICAPPRPPSAPVPETEAAANRELFKALLTR